MYGNRGSTGSNVGQRIPGYDVNQMQNFNPQQMELFKNMFAHVSPDSYTSRLAMGDSGLFEEMERPALRQFSGIQGNIASRFSGMGAGARKSSGFQNTMSSASSQFAQDLQGRRQDLQRNAIKDLMSMSSDLLGQRSFENVVTPKKKSFLEEFLMSLADNAGSFAQAGAKLYGA